MKEDWLKNFGTWIAVISTIIGTIWIGLKAVFNLGKYIRSLEESVIKLQKIEELNSKKLAELSKQIKSVTGEINKNKSDIRILNNELEHLKG